jgi:metallo-beta-lactamase family protein
MIDPLTIAFHGAARTVTGSRHLIGFGAARLLFDCGLYQGRRDEADAINRTFAFEPETVDTVVVSHAHLDHIGNLPTLVGRGYAGEIHVTHATAQLATFMLEDSAFLMQRDVEHVNRHRDRDRHPPREVLYAPGDVADTLTRFVGYDYHKSFTPLPGVEARYYDAGHILGSALTTLEFTSGGRTFRLGMSGDLGRRAQPILRDPEVHPGVDALVLESTYGDRLHPPADENERMLAEAIQRTVQRGGRVMVPAFAVGRAQELVATLHRMIGDRRVPDVPIFVDSPMAKQATQVFVRHPESFDDETRRQFQKEDGAPFGFRRLRYVASPDESRALNDRTDPCIIIAASGMCEGGRILHHLRHGIGNPKDTVLFVGFQAQGTLGRRIRDGAEEVRIFGEPYHVRAEVVALDGFSAHADQSELVSWVSRLDPTPRRIFLVHGELEPAEVLAGRLRERVGAEVFVPEKGQEFDLWK